VVATHRAQSAGDADGYDSCVGEDGDNLAVSTKLHWFYALGEHETVFGCGEGVAEALDEMAAVGAAAVLLISTCVAHVTGDDLDGLLCRLKGRLPIHLFHVPLPHFKGDTPEAGCLKVAEVLAPRLMDDEGLTAQFDSVSQLGLDAIRTLGCRIGAEMARVKGALPAAPVSPAALEVPDSDSDHDATL
jgi:hypothetical protein